MIGQEEVMRRPFLFQTLALGIVFMFSGYRAFAADTDAILGAWRLLDPAADEAKLPQHRMDLRFKNESGELKGAIVSRRDGTEIPLASAKFDGTTLRFQMVAPNGRTQTEMPVMVMTESGGAFR